MIARRCMAIEADQGFPIRRACRGLARWRPRHRRRQRCRNRLSLDAGTAASPSTCNLRQLRYLLRFLPVASRGRALRYGTANTSLYACWDVRGVELAALIFTRESPVPSSCGRGHPRQLQLSRTRRPFRASTALHPVRTIHRHVGSRIHSIYALVAALDNAPSAQTAGRPS